MITKTSDNNTKQPIREGYKGYFSKKYGYAFAICCIAMLIFNSCFDAPVFDDVPSITFNKWQSPRNPVVITDFDADSLSLFIDFKDGDGDLGDTTTGASNIFIKDLKTNIIDTYQMDPIPANGSVPDISGTIEVKLGPNLIGRCLLPGVSTPLDTTKYEVYIVDRAGNESNKIITGEVYFKCE
ncbi:MAG: hypothetical protein K1X55_15170 [Chitinophagales bacterium]|nr:hypothetical protein [Chitinophagales bacterium]